MKLRCPAARTIEAVPTKADSSARPRPFRVPHFAFRIRSKICVALLVLLPLACGYRLAGTQLQLPEGVHSVHVGEFENRSRQFGLDRQVSLAFEREFHRRGVLRVAEEPGAGDSELSGVIRSFSARPVAFDAEDEALEYEAELVLDVALRRRSDGALLWEASELQEVEDYSVAARIVVPSSSQFQRGALAVGDLRRLTDIQLAETEKRLAIERLVSSLVQDVHDRILDDF